MTSLGGPINGISPVQTITNYKSSEQIMSRRILTKSWNTAYATGTFNSYSRAITPFRAVNNSGDFLSRTQYSCGGPNPQSVSKPGRRIGTMWSNCDNTGVPASSCNVKFVADSSDYVKYKKLYVQNQNYNDSKFGGDESNGSYVPLMRVRRG
jgi:hypothetical protein